MKLEYLNITNSVKDREAIIEVCKAKELGYKTVITASTGNLAASLAAYSSKIGIACIAYVPWNISDSKISQIMKYGANVKKIKKTYDQLAEFAKEEALSKKYFLGGLQAFRCEGYKTVSYELFLQSIQNDSKVFVSMGDGTTLTGIFNGFNELKDYGYIKNIPQIIGVQEKGIDPIVNAFKENQVLSIKKYAGVAKAININNPQDVTQALYAIRKSGGNCISVSSLEIIDACKELASKEGIYSEYASAATFAAFKKVVSDKSRKVIILIISGSGLKN